MKPQKYEEKCDVKTLFLLTPKHKEKLVKISDYKEKPYGQILRELIELEFKELFGDDE